jgi:hypothetical protein
LQERYKNDLSNHPELDLDFLLKAGLFDGFNRNQIYGISNTTTNDIWTNRSVLTAGSSQSGLSSRSPGIQAIVQEQVEA